MPNIFLVEHYLSDEQLRYLKQEFSKDNPNQIEYIWIDSILSKIKFF